MNIQKIILVIVLSIITTGSAFSQKKIGVFVHGFNGGSEKWLQESGVPQAWKDDGIINDYVALDYETMELKNPSSQALLLSKFIGQMESVGSKDDEWIIVGHSLGGIVGRILYPQFRALGYNIVAVTSVGGPSQGAAATNVSKSTITQNITRIKDKIVLAQKHEIWAISFGLSMQELFLNLEGNTDPSPKELIASIPDYLETALDTALGYTDVIIETGAKGLIGLEGEVIQEINNLDKNNINLHPQNYLSIIGAEKDKAPIRMIGHIFENEDLKNESETIGQIQDLRNQYFSAHEGWFRQLAKRYDKCRIFKSCRDSRDYAKYRENLWRQAKLEIDRLGTTWATIINSHRFESITYQEYVPYCGDNDGFGDGPGYSGPGGFFNIDELIDEPCSTNPGGEYHYRTETVQIADKNDGVVNIHSVLWSKGDSFIGDHNQYFDDVPADGGYNHFELRNHKRAYTLPGQFAKGDLNPSMEEVSKWIDSGFRF